VTTYNSLSKTGYIPQKNLPGPVVTGTTWDYCISKYFRNNSRNTNVPRYNQSFYSINGKDPDWTAVIKEE